MIAPASRKNNKVVLNSQQSAAIETIHSSPGKTILLHGVTGSGKTQVYIQSALRLQKSGLSSIILVPEISLTPQLVAEFTNHFDNVLLTHSGMTEAQRQVIWQQALEADKPIVAIGPRSALFLPIAKLGMIVIDECHEPGYKQDKSPKYSAIRVASRLAQLQPGKIRVVLGSATPSVTDYFLAQSTASPIVEMNKTAMPTSDLNVSVVDCKNRDNFREHIFLSDPLLKQLRQSLTSGKQSLLFINRRGTAPTTLCAQCGWNAACDTCFVPLTLHADHHALICHLCLKRIPLPPNCPECHHPDIIFKGIGTKMVEQALAVLFTKAKIARFDADNLRGESLMDRYQEVYDSKIDILIGTQIVAKGLDLPNLQTVGIIQADSGLQLPDYQSEERVFQLICQVCGRVGRGQSESRVILQTYRPEHPVIIQALARDYQSFYLTQKIIRHQAKFPPFVYLLKMTCSYKTEHGAIVAATKLSRDIRSAFPDCIVQGPAPAFYERLGGAFRWQIIVKSKRRSTLLAVAKIAPSNWQIDLDPSNLL